MTKPILDNQLVYDATYSEVVRKDTLIKIAFKTSDTLMSIGNASCSVLPGLSNAFAGNSFINIDTTPTTAENLFSAKGPLACKLREYAALDYILGNLTTKHAVAQNKIKELFDYSEHFVEKDNNKTNISRYKLARDMDDYLCRNGSYRHPDVEKEMSFSFTNETRYSNNSSWTLDLKNIYGIEFSLTNRNNVIYTHPNEHEKVVSNEFLFKEDGAQAMRVMDEYIVAHGFQYLNYDFNKEAQKLIPIVLDISAYMNVAADKTKDYLAIDLQKGSISLEEKFKVEFVRRNYSKPVELGFFIITRHFGNKITFTISIECFSKTGNVEDAVYKVSYTATDNSWIHSSGLNWSMFREQHELNVMFDELNILLKALQIKEQDELRKEQNEQLV